MKWRFLCVALLLCILLIPNEAFADTLEELEQNVDESLDNIDFSQVNEISNNYFGSVADKIKDIINGNFDSAESFFDIILSVSTEGIKSVIPQLSLIFAVLVIIGLIRNISGGIISQSTDNVISFVGIAVIFSSLLSLIVGMYKQIYETLYSVSALTDASMPILLTLLVANGGVTLSSVCQPSMVMFSTVVIKIIIGAVLPLSVFSLVFSVIGNISTDVKVGKMSGFLNSASSWILGVIFMLFSAFTSVQGISASAIDGVSYRAAKFATKNYIPILGGYLSDGFDIVLASASLIKNAFGVVALLILMFIIVKPIISILVVNLGLQAVSALCEPIVDEKYIKMLGGMSKTLTFLAILVIAVAFMFCILALIAICCANVV